ncbi:hypothetical protein A1O7_05003 [Cladophialophora yegresii CBS 114405]|uniref:AB hydrolase-1 domain-containing protein n=1 Tax=Cladophialophora yegresii CBS 114405 TaxID=1182544 RepID=W9W793_9EURO|nr:uncharacterized protein A1O7_05003 [Cladophialophora yegresii CBS 114405]EXJ60850.1 hypothetical protein A1O7_05003 [Cladophialophora yegresii CBS 114405]
METLLHAYHPKRTLLLLEYINRSNKEDPSEKLSSPPNVLLFVGGLYDNFRWPRYLDDLAALFPRDVPDQQWRVMQVQLSSNGRSWGLFDLDRDVEEIATAISYIRDNITQSPATPVILMGHSTGCQDSFHYLVSPISPSSPRPNISGAILQAPVSDREAILHELETNSSAKAAYDATLAVIRSTPFEKYKTTILPFDLMTPLFGPSPVSISRFLSLVSPDSPTQPSMDDYFSSDLSDERLKATFGQIGHVAHLVPPPAQKSQRSILVLQGADDQSIPPHVDKAALLSRWKAAIESSGSTAPLSRHSAIIEHATHDIAGSSIQAKEARLVKMRSAVLRYLEDTVGGVGDGAGQPDHEYAPWKIWERDMKAIQNEREANKAREKTVEESKL